MAEVDSREVYDVFFNWNDSTSMTLLENGARRGTITIAGGSGIDSEGGVFSNLLSGSGTLEKFDPVESTTTVDLFWKGLLEFDREISLRGGELSIRIPKQQLSTHLSYSGEPLRLDASASIGGQEIFKIGGGENDASALPLHLLPMGSMVGGLSSVNPSNLKWESEARMGNFSFGGRDMRAYLLILRAVDQDQVIRVYLSEVGEPLRIESDLGFEAVSEILVPLDAYRNQQNLNSDD
tara:strand:+ start:266 stop:976 length:711 start_codon:yes stop_codon:yes gene_type:complete